MPKPCDAFQQPATRKGPWEAFAAPKQKEEDNSPGVWDYVKGAGDAGLTLLTGLGSGALATLGAPVATASSMLQGDSSEKALARGNEYAKQIMEGNTWQPRTEIGENISDKVGDFLNRNVIPMAGLHMQIPARETLDAVKANKNRANFINEFDSTPPPEAPVVDMPPAPGTDSWYAAKALERQKQLQAETIYQNSNGEGMNPQEFHLRNQALAEGEAALNKQRLMETPEGQTREMFPELDESPNPQPQWYRRDITEETPLADTATRDFINEPFTDKPIGSEMGTRTPRSEGVPLELDSHGTMREAVERPTETTLPKPSSLESAVDKLSNGRSFDMTAEEKIAWNKAQNLVREFEPEFSKLSDREIAAKAMDREWVESAVQKARQLDEMFADIEKRATNARDIADATKKREQLQDNLQQLEEQLRDAAYKPESSAQGPKTRAAQQQMKLPQSQRGGIDIGAIGDALGKIFTGVEDALKGLGERFAPNAGKAIGLPEKGFILQPPTAEQIISRANNQPDSSSNALSRLTAAGGALESLTQKNAIVKGVYDTFNYATTIADRLINKTVIPVQKMFANMKSKDLMTMGDTMLAEMFARKRFTPEELQRRGFTNDMLDKYARFREMREHSRDIINQQRQADGMSPIHDLEFGLASVWRGDFSKGVYKDGKPVWWLRGTTPKDLAKQEAALLKKFPGLTVDKDTTIMKSNAYAKTDLASAYTLMKDLMGRDHPLVKQIEDWYDAEQVTKSNKALAVDRHFKEKGNVRGFVGDRPDRAGTLKEMREMFDEQFKYVQNSYRWSAMQEARRNLAPVFKNEELRAAQPNTFAWADDYAAQHFGFGEADWIKGVNDAIKTLGLNPKTFGKIGGLNKSLFIMQKLAVNSMYALAQAVQPIFAVPHIVGNILENGPRSAAQALINGNLGGLHTLADHMGIKVPKDMLSPYHQEALKFIEDNHVLGHGEVEGMSTSNGPLGAPVRALKTTVSLPEVVVRSQTFNMFASMLKNDTRFATNLEKFNEAARLTQASMGDYRAGERPMMFSKLGGHRNWVDAISTFPMNYFNQVRYMAHEMKRNPAKGMAMLASMMAVQWYIGGLQGVPGFESANELWKLIRDNSVMSIRTLSPNTWAKVKDTDLKSAVLHTLGEKGLYGDLSVRTGLALSNRSGAPSLEGTLQNPFGPIISDFKQGMAVAKAALDSDNTTKKRQALLEVAPSGLRGALENNMEGDAFVKQGDTYLSQKTNDMTQHTGRYRRTQGEQDLRLIGARSQREQMVSDRLYEYNTADNLSQETARDLPRQVYDKILNGQTKDAVELMQTYAKLNGNPMDMKSILTRAEKHYTDALQQATKRAGNKLQLQLQLARIHKMQKDYDAKYGTP